MLTSETLAQIFSRNGAGRDPHHRLARRGAPAAAIVAKSVFLLIRVVGVTGPKAILDLLVVARALILVFDQKPDRRAGGAAFEHARQDAHRVGLAALGRELRGARPAPIDVRLANPPRSSSSPGGQPSTTQPSAGPWLSPKLVTVNSLPNVFPATRHLPDSPPSQGRRPQHENARRRPWRCRARRTAGAETRASARPRYCRLRRPKCRRRPDAVAPRTKIARTESSPSTPEARPILGS